MPYFPVSMDMAHRPKLQDETGQTAQMVLVPEPSDEMEVDNHQVALIPRPFEATQQSPPSESASSSTDEEERLRRLCAKNRRKRYLELHPDYFDSSLELADPLLYDRLIRRFQTAAEREQEGREKGFSGVMYADVWRTEAKSEALQNPDPHSLFNYRRGPDGRILAEDKDEAPINKEEGQEWWEDEMRQRFLRGDDTDFDYKKVDECVEYDDPEEERDIQEAYFDSMEPYWDSDGEGKDRVLTGETGIQDY